MKALKFAAYLIYRKARKDIPYFSTLCFLTFFIDLNLSLLLVLTNSHSTAMTCLSHYKWKYYIFTFIVGLPTFLMLLFLIKENELKQISYPPEKIKKGNILLVTDFIATFILLIVVSELKRK